jgi:copper chaperone
MEFNIPDMSCGGCANAITRAVTVKIVTVTSTLPPARVIEAIEAAGFHPSLKG